jgi:uncharacterized protein YjiS (DUF1127 family)
MTPGSSKKGQKMLTSTGKLTAAAVQSGTLAPGCTGKPCEARCSLREACRRLWRAQRTRAELSALSDPEFKDIGLFRGDIGRMAVENYR